MRMVVDRGRKWNGVVDGLLALILLAAAFFRLTGVNWDEGHHPHPDERFLTMVETAITPVSGCADASLAILDCPLSQRIWLTPAQYYDTATSTLNPHNRGYGFYVYGTLPLFLVRVTAEISQGLSTAAADLAAWMNDLPGESALGAGLARMAFRMRNATGYDGVNLVGRQLSALADLGTILLLFFIVRRVYNRWAALLAAAFSAVTVMQIQQAHFFTVDHFVNFFMFLALFFAVEIAFGKKNLALEYPTTPVLDGQGSPAGRRDLLAVFGWFFRDRLLWLSLAFGFALGMAAASKINAAVLAVMLPAALLLWVARQEKGRRPASDPLSIKIVLFLVLGALASLLAFRIFQPYAFSGPGFLGLKPEAGWVDGIRQQRAQAGGLSDVPWALQWARRTHLYSFENLTLYGLGLPLGILAWAGFLWMGWCCLKGEWRQHLLLWGWTAAYFLWQSLQFNPTMRYQLPVYPLLGMMAAWLVLQLWERRQAPRRAVRLAAWGGLVIGALVLAATTAWALAFTGIYTRTETRLEASRWIYQNIPGPINLELRTPAGGLIQQPLPATSGTTITSEIPYQVSLVAQESGVLEAVTLPYVSSHALRVSLLQNASDPAALASGTLWVLPGAAAEMDSQFLLLSPLPAVYAQQVYRLRFEVLDPQVELDLCGTIELLVVTAAGSPYRQQVEPGDGCIVRAGEPYELQFAAEGDGTLEQMHLTQVHSLAQQDPRTMTLRLSNAPAQAGEQVMASAAVTGSFAPRTNARGEAVRFTFAEPVVLEKGHTYYITLSASAGALSLSGSAPVNETDFDLGLPFPVDGYNGFGGLYVNGLNLQVYYDDDANKLARLTHTLDQADVIFIPSNHQFAQIVRLPERYPLMTAYYRALIGCPPAEDIIWCYNVAEPGMFEGSLGFDLAATFTSFPSLGGLSINDQFAEEAFTIYDHVKVFVFRKNAEYDAGEAATLLGNVDLSHVVHLLPGQAADYKTLMLPADQLEQQQAGGTWSDLFDRDALQNRYPWLGLVLWYAVIFLLGVLVYPLVRAALPGLADRGYPMARVVGLLLWAWLAWMAGSLGLGYSRGIIAAALALIALLGGWQAWRQRAELRQELRSKWKYFLLVEGLFLAFFCLDLLIRLGNPDLWHPAKGGERPMDLSYFNAVLKSSSFPPYDPWFAGGTINYYYYGYVIVGTPVKLLGIVPTVAFNFILPTLFACVGISAFSVGYNLLKGNDPDLNRWTVKGDRWALLTGLLGSAAVVLAGNLGIVRMFYQGFQRLAAPGGSIADANIFQRLFWAGKGFILALSGSSLPYVRGDFYWIPSRVLPDSSGSPITEFPLFTFIFSDLHAHMIAMMITVVAIAWALSVLRARGAWRSKVDAAAGFFLGALCLGALKPTNTWDFYTYLVLVLLVLAYTLLRYARVERLPAVLAGLPAWLRRALTAGAAVAALAALSLLMYQPFNQWFSQGVYVGVETWKGARSDLSSYLTQWGIFLFFIVSWMTWETRNWMAETPLSAVRRLRPYLELILALVVLLVLMLAGQQAWVMSATQNVPWKGVTILWLALPLAAWATVLMLRPGLPDTKRLVLFMTGTSLLVTMVVELVVVLGDIGRMNTVFKFYLQAWIMLGICAAAALGWLLPELHRWRAGWRTAWQAVAVVLATCAALFLIIGGADKVRDRWIAEAPHSLDSMAFMDFATYADFGVDLILDEDARAIRWMQENISGSPVIVEAHCVEYHWGSRFTIYTGLPGVVGWNWHQRQQRGLAAEQVWERVNEIGVFYGTTDLAAAQDFLAKYHVRYIIVGQLERAAYPVEGIAKFDANDGGLWRSVYRDGLTAIYEVLPEEGMEP